MRTFIAGRWRSIQRATAGVIYVMRSQRNAWVHLLATLAVVALAWLLRLTAAEWCWMVAAIGVVWMAEALNTAVELVCDVASPEFHPVIGRAKDVAAGGVLVAAVMSVLIGGCVMGPHLW